MRPAEIRDLRKELGMSYVEFAKSLGFEGANAHVTVWRWETGARTPSEQTLRLMKMMMPLPVPDNSVQ